VSTATITPIRDRLLPKIDRNGPVPIHAPELGPCWMWNGHITRVGYGAISKGQLTTSRSYEMAPAHRVSYEVHVGPIPKGLEIDHLCRVRACVNPAHLEAVTHSVNVSRGTSGRVRGAEHRAKTHCPRGHPYSDENTYLNTRGHRECRTCLGVRRVNR
jgi:hypothetical protein